MIEKEIQDILGNELATKDPQEALLDTYYLIAIKILNRLFKSVALPGEEIWKIIRKTTYARSRLCYFKVLDHRSTQNVKIATLTEVVSLYKIWLETMDYFRDKYSSFSYEELDKVWPEEAIVRFRNLVAKKYKQHEHQFQTTKTLAIEIQDFELMNETFNWIQELILGKELFIQYLEEFNKALETLRLLQAELMIPKTDSIN